MDDLRRRDVLASNVGETRTPEKDEDHGHRVVAGSLLLAGVLIVLGVIALVLPWPLQRPLWIKAEVVFGMWWIVWAAVLAGMLYYGLSLRRGAEYQTDSGDEPGPWWRYLDNPSGGEIDLSGAEGAALIAALVLLGILIFVGWLVIEVIAPLVVPLGYAAVWWMLARVLRSGAECKRNLFKSVVRGVTWASAYTLPLVFGVALLHFAV